MSVIGTGSTGVVHEFNPKEFAGKLTWLEEETEEPLVVKRRKLVSPFDGATSQTLGETLDYELTLLAILRHPNIVEAVGIHLPPLGSKYGIGIVMPQANWTAYSILTAPAGSGTRRVLFEIATGVQYIHDSGFIHRDLKPCNILMYDDSVKICDFGTAIRVQEPLVPLIGTYPYCAPEQLTPEYGYPADMWSIGCIAYDFICQGRRLVRGLCNHPRDDIIAAVVGCPCIPVSRDDLRCLAFSESEISRYLQGQPPATTWTQYFRELGFLERAMAITKSSESLEALMSGLLCVNPDQRMSANKLRRLLWSLNHG